jgi:Autoinducer binding domain
MPILSSPDQASRGGPPSRVGKAIASALTAIGRASIVAELFGVIAKWRNESGFAHLIYHAADVPACNKINPLSLPTYEDDWVKHYVEQD